MTEAEEAADPNTPGSRLLELASEHLDAVLDNPALPLIVVAQPDFWLALFDVAGDELAASPRCPPELVAWALSPNENGDPNGGYDLLTSLLSNPALPMATRREAFFRRPIQDPGRPFTRRPLGVFYRDRFRKGVPALAQVLAPEELALLERADFTAMPQLAQHDETMTVPELERLASLGVLGRLLAARHPRCPSALLMQFFRDEPFGAGSWTTEHPNLAPEHQLELAAHEEAYVREELLKNPNLTDEARAAAQRGAR